MVGRSRTLLLVLVILGLIVLAVLRSRSVREQHLRGHATSGNSSGSAIQAETVLSVGNLYVTYNSTEHESAVWIARPSETFLSWIIPPHEPPFQFVPVVRWNDAGHGSWFNTGPASADLLIDLAPQSNHRLAIVRISCSSGTCGASARERGLVAGTKLWVADDGTSLVLTDTSITLYGSIKDLIDGTGETTIPRLTNPAADELGAPSRTVTMLLSQPEDLAGEMVNGANHNKVRFRLDEGGRVVALTLNNNFQIVVDGGSTTRFWDCPAGLLDGKADCTVYQAPPDLPRSVPVALSDTECGIVISRGGWTWLIRRNAQSQDLFPGDGIAGCANGEIVAYRKGRISYLTPKREPLSSKQQTAYLDRLD